MAQNSNLHRAKAAQNDEFYTQLSDVSKELAHYKHHFKDKIVFCNCDDPTWSAFWRYFHLNFSVLGLKKLISTHYDRKEPTYKMIYEGGNDNDVTVGEKIPLQGNGDFRNQECLDLLDESDIVVTNGPFSLFREYIATLVAHDKKFIVWGNNNAITYKEIFPLLKDNKIWLGYMVNKTCIFRMPDNYERWDEKITAQMNDGHKYGKVPAISVFTNLNIPKRHEKLILWKKYTPEEYQKYDNYAAVNVNKVQDIPCDYYPCWYKCQKANECQYAITEGMKADAISLCETPNNGCIGVPITYMDKHNPEQFEIIGATESEGRGFSNGLFDEASKIKQPVISVNEKIDMTNPNNTILAAGSRQQAAGNRSCTNEYLSEQRCNGIIGVPITFLDKYNPDQFCILGLDRYIEGNPRYGHRFTIANKETYARILIRHKMTLN